MRSFEFSCFEVEAQLVGQQSRRNAQETFKKPAHHLVEGPKCEKEEEQQGEERDPERGGTNSLRRSEPKFT